MRNIILAAMVAVLTVSGVAMAAPENNNDKGVFLVLGATAGATYYSTLDDNLFDLGLVPSGYNKLGIGYRFNEKNQVSVYITPTYGLLGEDSFYTTQGHTAADKPKSDKDLFTAAGGVLSGGGLGAEYVFKPSPSYGFGPYVNGRSYTALTCDNFYKESSKNMTCDYSKASSFETGLSANYYFNNGFSPFVALGYSQMNFDSHPYHGTSVVVGLNYIFNPVRNADTAALIVF